MKIQFLVWLLLVVTSCIYAQSIEGEWKGYYRNTNDQIDIEYTLFFSRINDSTFRAESRTIMETGKAGLDTAFCILQGGFLTDKIMYLEETRAIKDFNTGHTDGCLQLMKLFYSKKKKGYTLDGTWYTNDNKCGNGIIHLTKSM